MLQFMTGPRRTASGLLTIAKPDYGTPKIMPFLSPYACGDDKLIVEETPAADVHVDDAEPRDAEPGAYLDEMDGSALSIRMGREIAGNILGLSAWYVVWWEWEEAGCLYIAVGNSLRQSIS
ncbi:unnamed protein product [Ectocarpus sp. 12 AP-2014]